MSGKLSQKIEALVYYYARSQEETGATSAHIGSLVREMRSILAYVRELEQAIGGESDIDAEVDARLADAIHAAKREAYEDILARIKSRNPRSFAVRDVQNAIDALDAEEGDGQ